MKGKFIVIEGGDCTGKTTQAELLVKKLKELGKEVKVLDFPTYEKTPGGTTVKWYLEGKFGDLDSVSPEVATLTFSLDRYQFAKENQKALDDGKTACFLKSLPATAAYQLQKARHRRRCQDAGRLS